MRFRSDQNLFKNLRLNFLLRLPKRMESAKKPMKTPMKTRRLLCRVKPMMAPRILHQFWFQKVSKWDLKSKDQRLSGMSKTKCPMMKKMMNP